MKLFYLILIISLAGCKVKPKPQPVSAIAFDSLRLVVKKNDSITKRILANSPDWIAKTALTRIQALTVSDSLKDKKIETMAKASATQNVTLTSLNNTVTKLSATVTSLNTTIKTLNLTIDSLNKRKLIPDTTDFLMIGDKLRIRKR